MSMSFESQQLIFYLNAYEIKPKAPSKPLKAFRISLNMGTDTRKHVATLLRQNNVLFHYNPSDYSGYSAGYYIYDVDKWRKIMDSDEIISRLSHSEESVEAISYVAKGALLRLIDNKLRAISILCKVTSKEIDERKFCFVQGILKGKSSMFEYYRCFTYRVEYLSSPTRKLLLLILPSIRVSGKDSLKNLIDRGVPLKLLIGLPFKVQQDVERSTDKRIRRHIGFLHDVKGDKALVRPADLSISKIECVPLSNLYPVGRIDFYKKIIEFLGEDYDLLDDYLGKLTFSREERRQIKDAPLRMRKEIERLRREIFAQGIFPLELQEVRYVLSDDLVPLELVEE